MCELLLRQAFGFSIKDQVEQCFPIIYKSRLALSPGSDTALITRRNNMADKDTTKKGSSNPTPDATPAGGSHATGSAPGGNPRHAPLPDGSNRVPDDAKGYNPGSVVTG